MIGYYFVTFDLEINKLNMNIWTKSRKNVEFLEILNEDSSSLLPQQLE